MTINVYWAYADASKNKTAQSSTGMHGGEMTQCAPVRCLSHFKDVLIKKNPAFGFYTMCPSYSEYFKNSYVIKSNIETTLKLIKDGNNYFFDSDIGSALKDTFSILSGNSNESADPTYKSQLIQQTTSIVFFADKPLVVEQIPASLDENDFTNNTKFLSGCMDINKWFRPINPSFWITNENTPIKLSVGDPQYYLKFNTDDKIVMHRFMMNDRLMEIMESCLSTKYYKKNIPLKKLYEMFNKNGFQKRVLSEIKKNLL